MPLLPASFRCVVLRTATISPNFEVIVPVHLNHRQCLLKDREAYEGPRIIEPCNNTRLQRKGLFISRTLVTAGGFGTGSVPVRVVNSSDEHQSIGAQTVVGLAKPVVGVTNIEIPEWNSAPNCETRKGEENSDGNLLPDPLKDLWLRSSKDLTQEESNKVTELLCKHTSIFQHSDHDIGRTNINTHKIDT